jgi:hypothetical protein
MAILIPKNQAHAQNHTPTALQNDFFSSLLEKATASYSSPAYQEALKALGDGAVRDVRIIEGSE